MMKLNKLFPTAVLALCALLIISIANISILFAQTAVSIDNPGFENGMNDWVEVDPAAISGVAYSGANSLKIQGSPARVHQVVNVSTNTEYTLSAYVNGAGQIGVDDLNGLSHNTTFDVSDWTQVSTTFTTNSETSLQIFAAHNNSSDDVRFDDFSLISSDTSSPTATPTTASGCSLTTASLTATDEGLNDGHGPELAVDGDYQNTNSRWSANGDGRWIQFDLGSVSTVAELSSAWYNANQRTAYFDVETSLNGSNWSSLLTNGESQGNTSLNVDWAGAVSARYVRIIGHGNSSNSWNSILEVEIKTCGEATPQPTATDGPTQIPPTATNTAVAPTATPVTPTSTPVVPTATSTTASGCSPMTANLTATDEGLNDGHGPALAVDGNYADVESRWSSNGNGRWIQFDLGGAATVAELSSAWYKADQRTAYFDVETSLNGSNWSSLLTNGESQGNTSLNVDWSGTVSARYVRLIGYGNSSNSWNSILEVEIKTCGAVTPEPTPTQGPTQVPTVTSTPDPNGVPIPSSITDGSLFALEGENPHPLVDPYTLVFVPLEAQVTTPNGNGWRHEYKIRQDLRVAMTETYEDFQATIKVDMSDGGKTIVAQHHASDLGTIMKLYVSDSSESGFYDSIPANGIFDVYVRLRNTSGNEEKFPLGTIQSGDTFTFRVINDYGFVSVSAFGETFELEVEDDSASYLKFGNYLQSQYPDGVIDCGESGNSDSFAECYEEIGITESTITMTNVSYTRIAP